MMMKHVKTAGGSDGPKTQTFCLEKVKSVFIDGEDWGAVEFPGLTQKFLWHSIAVRNIFR